MLARNMAKKKTATVLKNFSQEQRPIILNAKDLDQDLDLD